MLLLLLLMIMMMMMIFALKMLSGNCNSLTKSH